VNSAIFFIWFSVHAMRTGITLSAYRLLVFVSTQLPTAGLNNVSPPAIFLITCMDADKRPLRLLNDGQVVTEALHSVKIFRHLQNDVTLEFNFDHDLTAKITKVQFAK